MTIDTLFLVLIPTYLVLIAYGQIGARKRGLTPKMRVVTGALRVMLPPVAVILALLSTGDRFFILSWGVVTLGMAVVGAVVAGLVEIIAPRVGA